jgi:hypothetical protein
MVLGLGALVANSICPWLIQEVYTVDGVTNFRGLFLVPCLTALGAAIVLAIFFHPPKQAETPAGGTAPAPSH